MHTSFLYSLRFVDYLEQRLPADGGSEMSLVFDALVQRFLTVEQYANDIRYVNFCIRCVSPSEIGHTIRVCHSDSLNHHSFIITIIFYYSVKQASFYPDPLALYSYIFSKGVGTRTAALYVAWAQQLEQRGLNEQADALYQKAVENQAQPADTIADELR